MHVMWDFMWYSYATFNLSTCYFLLAVDNVVRPKEQMARCVGEKN